MSARRAATLAVVLAAASSAAVAGADSFTPVALNITIAPVARLGAPLAITVHVSADPGVLDDRTGPMRIQVKLAPECGGTYQYTPGTVLMNRELSPQPATGHAYSAVASGSAGRPAAYGTQSVCAFLDDDYESFANNTSDQVNVSKACTAAAARYDAARRRRRKNRQQLAADQRAARQACGPGVPL